MILLRLRDHGIGFTRQQQAAPIQPHTHMGGMNVPEFRPCPACRGYDLERRWCHVCDGRGVVDVEAQQKERAEMVKLLRAAGIEVRD
ncbi:hypothetical protein EQH75_19205 [Pseudomonas aeruginosa]|nr:hypothetical protein EQH80_26300 [Pseudomonas aeruginosa]RWY21928.1 hypothetical protein EQH75_19205 [Pseudomonas aeruginosa]RWY90932.1 hypothetical protein EQH73_24300 [Pseudomonas aeruginosa]